MAGGRTYGHNLIPMKRSFISMYKHLRHYYTLLTLLVLGCGLFAAPLPAHATSENGMPEVTYLSVYPTSVSSRQYASLTWTITGGGHEITFPCIAGIKVRRAENETDIPCGVVYSVSQRASDDMMFSISNTTGKTQTITFTVTPKDSGGGSYASLAETVDISVNPLALPILTFEAATTTLRSGSTTAFSWTADKDLIGVNIWFACTPGIKVMAPAITDPISGEHLGYLPCGQAALPQNLSANGSVDLMLFNENTQDASVEVRALPALAPDADGNQQYDVTHSMGGVVTVLGTRPITPLIESIDVRNKGGALHLASSQAHEPFKTLSGATSTITWTGTGPYGTNFSISCADGIRAYLISEDETGATSTQLILQAKQPEVCDRPAFSSAIDSDVRTMTLLLVNDTDVPRAITVTLLPARSQSEYLQGQPLTFFVLGKSVTTWPGLVSNALSKATTLIKKLTTANTNTSTSTSTGAGAGIATSTAKTATSSTATKSPSASPSPSKKPTTTTTSTTTAGKAFTLTLKKGSYNSQVKALQKLLAKDPALYPEAAATGYFGPATEKAVKRFQLKNRIHRPTDEGYGQVDKATRDVLNTL